MTMSHGPLNILIADDDEGDRKQVKRALHQAGLSCECIETANLEETLAASDQHDFDCAFIDYQLPGHDGLHCIAELHARLPDLAIIMATGQGDEMVATEAMKRGASDYLPKKLIHADSIKRVVENAVEKAALRRKVAQQREELESFAAVLAHDLKSPIRSIQVYAETIEKDLGAETINKDKVVDRCRRIAGAGLHMAALIDALHRYTTEDAAIAPAPVDMGKVMQHTLSHLEHDIRARGASVTYGAMPVVIGDAAQLSQLLQNMIGNGIKYCAQAVPTIQISASRDRDSTWLFAVKDNGIGIPEEYYRQIFAPFKRLHTPGEYEGIGLGLATCKKIVERSKGAIWCQSKEREGTTFFFTLPAAEPRA